MNKKGQSIIQTTNWDIIALLLIALGGFLLYKQNSAGWILIILGILKYLIDR